MEEGECAGMRGCEGPEAGEAHYRYCCNKPSNNSDKYEREAGVTNVSLSYDYLARTRSLIRPFVSLVRSFVRCCFREFSQDVSSGEVDALREATLNTVAF